MVGGQQPPPSPTTVDRHRQTTSFCVPRFQPPPIHMSNRPWSFHPLTMGGYRPKPPPVSVEGHHRQAQPPFLQVRCHWKSVFLLLSLLTEQPTAPMKTYKWRISFNGEGDPFEFLERLEEICFTTGTDTDRLLPHLHNLFQGKAAAWFRNNRHLWSTFEEFVEDFRVFYFPVHPHEYLETEISRRLQKPDEAVTTYITDLQTLMRQHGSLTIDQQLGWLYRNVRPEFRFYLKR